jgi:hypothetical protein
LVDLADAPDLDVEPDGQGVDDRDTPTPWRPPETL